MKEKHYSLLPPLLGIGSGMWMTPGSFNYKPINKYFWIISTALIQQYNSLLMATRTMVVFPSWITWSHPKQTIPYLLVYHKPTHTDQYLQWDSNHNLAAKYSVIGTLTHRASTVCTTPKLLNEGLKHLREALAKCKYPRWAIYKIQNKYINNNWKENGNSNNNQEEYSTQGPNNSTCSKVRTNKDKPSAGHIVVPYVQGLGENLQKICSRYGLQTYFKEVPTSSNCWSDLRIRTQRTAKNNVIYSYQCGEVDCDEKYIGENYRTLGKSTKNI